MALETQSVSPSGYVAQEARGRGEPEFAPADESGNVMQRGDSLNGVELDTVLNFKGIESSAARTSKSQGDDGKVRVLDWKTIATARDGHPFGDMVGFFTNTTTTEVAQIYSEMTPTELFDAPYEELDHQGHDPLSADGAAKVGRGVKLVPGIPAYDITWTTKDFGDGTASIIAEVLGGPAKGAKIIATLREEERNGVKGVAAHFDASELSPWGEDKPFETAVKVARAPSRVTKEVGKVASWFLGGPFTPPGLALRLSTAAPDAVFEAGQNAVSTFLARLYMNVIKKAPPRLVARLNA